MPHLSRYQCRQKNNEGETPLHVAIESRSTLKENEDNRSQPLTDNESIIQTLLAQGADCILKNNKGESPLQYARRLLGEDDLIVQMLQDKVDRSLVRGVYYVVNNMEGASLTLLESGREDHSIKECIDAGARSNALLSIGYKATKSHRDMSILQHVEDKARNSYFPGKFKELLTLLKGAYTPEIEIMT